jgi:hypothetical protein
MLTGASAQVILALLPVREGPLAVENLLRARSPPIVSSIGPGTRIPAHNAQLPRVDPQTALPDHGRHSAQMVGVKAWNNKVLH